MSKKCFFDCKAQQKIKKLSKKCFFDCKAQQKIKKMLKKCFFDCKARQKSKKCEKNAFLIVKRSKRSKIVKKVAGGGVFYPVVFFNSVHPVLCLRVDFGFGVGLTLDQRGQAKLVFLWSQILPGPFFDHFLDTF